MLTPTSASLSTRAAVRRVRRNSAGDSVAVAVTFAATGGTVSSDGLYTAGARADLPRRRCGERNRGYCDLTLAQPTTVDPRACHSAPTRS